MCGDTRTYGAAESIIWPQEMIGASRPMPKKLNVASAPTNPPKAIVATTITGVSELGSTCRRKMCASLAPSARAATTNSASRTWITDARMMRVMPVQPSTVNASTTAVNCAALSPSRGKAVSSRIAPSSTGIAKNTSVTRLMTVSHQPPW